MRTLDDPEWERTTVLHAAPVKEVRALKEQDGRDIVLTGSISLGHTQIEAGLVDEYRLFIYPVVQGRGRRLCPDGYAVPRLDLVRTASFANGLALLVHRVASGDAAACYGPGSPGQDAAHRHTLISAARAPPPTGRREPTV